MQKEVCNTVPCDQSERDIIFRTIFLLSRGTTLEIFVLYSFYNKQVSDTSGFKKFYKYATFGSILNLFDAVLEV